MSFKGLGTSVSAAGVSSAVVVSSVAAVSSFPSCYICDQHLVSIIVWIVGTYSPGAASSSGAATGTTAPATAGATSTIAVGILGRDALRLLAGGLRGARELDGDLALKDLLARKLSDGALSFGGGREVDKGVAHRAVGAGVLGNRNRLTICIQRSVWVLFGNDRQLRW